MLTGFDEGVLNGGVRAPLVSGARSRCNLAVEARKLEDDGPPTPNKQKGETLA